MNLKDKAILVVDYGNFAHFALRLARDFKMVYLYTIWKEGFPSCHKTMIGTEWKNGKLLNNYDGLPLQRITNFYEYISKVDMVLYTDVYNADEQVYMEQHGYNEKTKDYGKLVFGGRYGCDLELKRKQTTDLFKKLGVDYNKYVEIQGFDELRKHLKTVDDKYIKIPLEDFLG